MGIIFGSYLSEAVNSGIDPPDFIKLIRQKPYKGFSFAYKEDELLLGYFPFEDKTDHFFSHYSIISILKEKKAAQFAELCLLDDFTMETAYFDLSKRWKNIEDCFKNLPAELAYHDWLENYSDSGTKSDFPDFIRFLRKKDGTFMDFMRYQIMDLGRPRSALVRIEYRPGRFGGEILPLTEESAKRLGEESPIEIYTARFNDDSKETRSENRFKK